MLIYLDSQQRLLIDYAEVDGKFVQKAYKINLATDAMEKVDSHSLIDIAQKVPREHDKLLVWNAWKVFMRGYIEEYNYDLEDQRREAENESNLS